MSIAVNTGNKGWAKKVILKILGWGPEELTFRVQQYSYGGRKGVDSFMKILNQLTDSARSLIQDKFLSQALEDKIDEILKGKLSEGYWSLAEIRERLEGNRINGRVWSFLFQKLLVRSSPKEASLVLQKTMDRDFMEKMALSEIWLFKHYYPVGDSLREMALDKIHGAWKAKDPWLKYVVVGLVTNPVIKRGLAEREAFFKKALFQIERWYYRNLLLQGQAVDFALYNLMRLGDNEFRNLWWLAF